MRADNSTHREWLQHRDELTGPDGVAAVVNRHLHPTQDSKEIISKATKSKRRGGAVHDPSVRMVQEFYEFKAQGRPENIYTRLSWLLAQANRVLGEDFPEVEEAMVLEQEADSRDDPLQMRLLNGEWDDETPDEAVVALHEQAGASLMAAMAIERRQRERRMGS